MTRRGLCTVLTAVALGGSLSLSAIDPVKPISDASLQQAIDLQGATAGTKPKLSIKKGDYEVTIDGALKIENYFDKNSFLLNKHIPDENEYFKETVDLNFDFCYGEDKYGYDAVEAYVAIRHKGIWGKALTFADRDAGTTISSQVKLDETLFGGHDHFTGRAVLWFREGWIQFALNPIFSSKKGNRYIQYVKLGWFPFELGRGIALGSSYGYNKTNLGLYTYTGEDKSAPGIDLFGEVVKNTLWYDLYYAKFEERGKTLSDTLNLVKASYMGRKRSPWRGVAKNNEVVAAQLKWVATNSEKFGKLELNPYVYCNFASDQQVSDRIIPDSDTTLGAYGIGFEHAYKDFEWGSEVAFNYGSERLRSVDRNLPEIKRDNKYVESDHSQEGVLREQYSHIVYSGGKDKGKEARITEESKRAANVDFSSTSNLNGQPIPGYPDFTNKEDRFLRGYKNEFCGWMAVLDAAYNLKKWNLKLATSWSYASGDFDPHDIEKNKKYNEFIGLHEGYYGKRVPSIFILDQRFLKRPLSMQYPYRKGRLSEVQTDISFSNIQMYGMGLTWVPSYSNNRTVSINPNVIGFWVTKSTHKIVFVNNERGYPIATVSPELARDFMGTELNLIIKSEILKDLTLFGKFAAFIPGGYFQDVKGIPLEKDFFSKLAEENTYGYHPRQFRLGDDTAYHMNIGFDFKF